MRHIAARCSAGFATVQRHKAHIAAPVLAEWSASQAEIYAGLADYTAELERDARRIAAEARGKGNARLELQALAASRAHVELMAKLATASQQLEPEERLARERQAEAARLVEARSARSMSWQRGRLDQELVHDLLERAPGAGRPRAKVGRAAGVGAEPREHPGSTAPRSQSPCGVTRRREGWEPCASQLTAPQALEMPGHACMVIRLSPLGRRRAQLQTQAALHPGHLALERFPSSPVA